MEIIRYDDTLKVVWDKFIEESYVSSFLLKRDFIEYHKHLYDECSIIVKNDNELVLIIPACKIGATFSSFHFLTYGGFILPNKIYDFSFLEKAFIMAENYIKEVLKLEQILIKRIPWFYHKNPNEDDLFLFLKLKYRLFYKDISSVMKVDYDLLPSKKSYNHRKAKRDGLLMQLSNTSRGVLEIMNHNLDKYGKIAVHSFDQLDYLKDKFSNEIIFLEVLDNSRKILYGGCVLFIVNKVVHIQYLSSSELGRKRRVIDFIIGELLSMYPEYEYIDYGISTERQGSYLNDSLFNAKRELGFGSACYDVYEKHL